MPQIPTFSKSLIVTGVLSLVTACGGSSGNNEVVDNGPTSPTTPTTPVTDTLCENPVSTLPTIFLEFNSSQNVTAVLSEDGCYVTIESNGKPDHTSSYWDAGNASGLYVEPEDPELFEQRRSPGDIEDYINVFELTVPIEPELAETSSSTPLGAIGIALSGAPIFNNSEGNGMFLWESFKDLNEMAPTRGLKLITIIWNQEQFLMMMTSWLESCQTVFLSMDAETMKRANTPLT